jgi:hypothetical protein
MHRGLRRVSDMRALMGLVVDPALRSLFAPYRAIWNASLTPAAERPVRLFAWIDPAKTREPGEISICRVEHISALHREDGEMDIGCEVPGGPKALELLAKPREV